MKVRFKGRDKRIEVVLTEGDILEVSHKRALHALSKHPNFEVLPVETKRNGGNKGRNSKQGS